MRRGVGPGGRRSKKTGTFNPNDETRVKHTRIGVWDLYEETHPELEHLPASSTWESYYDLVQSFPYVWRMIKDVGSLKSCWLLLALFLAIEVIMSSIPAVKLWYSGQLLTIVQTAVDSRTVDTGLLLRIAAGTVACSLTSRFLSFCKQRIARPLNARIRQHFAGHIFRALARLDVPTFEDPIVRSQLDEVTRMTSRSSVAWETLTTMMGAITLSINLLSQAIVMISILGEQQDGFFLASLYVFQGIQSFLSSRMLWRMTQVWAATTKNDDYVRMEGMKRVVDDPLHRKEVVAGNMSAYLLSSFQEAQERVGDKVGTFQEMYRWYISRTRFDLSTSLKDILAELPQIVFTLRAVQYPASVPVSLASLNLIQNAATRFTSAIFEFYDRTLSISHQMGLLRTLYDAVHIVNRVPDGRIPFPENQPRIGVGISIEFRNVSFRYPGSEQYALRDISFRVERGQLCIILGKNGSGKSTVLKLIARLYDPSEGEILINGNDIRTYKLEDIRRAMSVLFQDYTHFPLSVKENIGLGDPENARNEDMIRQAAKLGGAGEFIDRLPDGFDTYLQRPVSDHYGGVPQGTKTLFGRTVDYGRVRGAGSMRSNDIELSGGQMQRIAVSRTFMRSLGPETKVGLLLFDEPSASLDPTAEYDLFQRLRALRGSNTMLFSSHRFGNLTRHADLILYMDDSRIEEVGTHESLLEQGGKYANLWNLQAQAFLP